MDERSAAILDAMRGLPATEFTATMRNPKSSADRTFRGPTLHDYVVATGLVPAKPEGRLADSYLLVTAEDGARSAVALAEVWPSTTDKQSILASEQDGEPIRNGVRLVLTGDWLAGRSIGGVVSVEAQTVAPASAPATGLELAGVLDRTGPVDLAALPAEAYIEVTTVEAAGHHGEVIAPRRYGGVRLYALLEHAGIRLDPDQHEDFLGKVIVASSADGRVAVIAGGEIEPRFQNGDVILATTQDGLPIEDGSRLIVPFDRRPGRWAKRITRIELRQA
ncbi:MAG: hypothetical protein WC211_04145 [Dehalococcoidia bacterium]